MSTQWIARREAVSPATDEDAAMAHSLLGRFESFEAGVLGLMDALESEALAWRDLQLPAGAFRCEALWLRVAGLRARHVDERGVASVEDDGVRYSLARVGS